MLWLVAEGGRQSEFVCLQRFYVASDQGEQQKDICRAILGINGIRRFIRLADAGKLYSRGLVLHQCSTSSNGYMPTAKGPVSKQNSETTASNEELQSFEA